MDIKFVSVLFTAGWGDKSVSSMSGLASEEELETLRALENKFPELLTVVTTTGPVSVNIADYARLWICGGDDDVLDVLYDLDVDDFATVVRKEVAPPGYQS